MPAIKASVDAIVKMSATCHRDTDTTAARSTVRRVTIAAMATIGKWNK